MSIKLRSRLAQTLAIAALAVPLLAGAAAAEDRYGAGPGDFYRGDPGYRPGDEPREHREPGIVLYSRGGFGGRTLGLDGDIADLRRVGFNDRASSLRVNWGVWEVCRDVNFGGRCVRIDRSVADLGRFDDEISSVRLLEAPRWRR
jgi:hypothetical protein